MNTQVSKIEKKSASHVRHIAKSITWRIVGTLDTILLAWLVTGNPLTGFKIGSVELITKMFLYYLHERIWFTTSLNAKINSKRRHIYKTISYRILGTIDTIILAWIISGDPMSGLTIGGLELISKMVLYYFHERIWYRFDLGIEDRRNEHKSKS